MIPIARALDFWGVSASLVSPCAWSRVGVAMITWLEGAERARSAKIEVLFCPRVDTSQISSNEQGCVCNTSDDERARDHQKIAEQRTI